MFRKPGKKELAWRSELRYLRAIVSGITHKKLIVREAVPSVLGCADEKGNIFIAKDHPLFDKIRDEITQETETGRKITWLLGKKKAKKSELAEDAIHMIRLGLTVHESMHVLLTNFAYEKLFLQKKVAEKELNYEYERQVFSLIQNIIEDPAIESFAPQFVGGVAIKALHFTITVIDLINGDFNEGAKSAFQEFVGAMIQFGDMGVLHGEFRYPEAKKTFAEIAPMFYNAVNEPDNKKRIDKSWDVFIALKQLWHNKSAVEMEDFIRQILEAFEKLLKNDPDLLNKQSTGQNAAPQSQQSSLNQKRNATIKKVTREEYEEAKELMKGQPSEKIPEDKDPEILLPEDFNEDDAREMIEEAMKNQDDNGNSCNSSLPMPTAQNQTDNGNSQQQPDGSVSGASQKDIGSSSDSTDEGSVTNSFTEEKDETEGADGDPENGETSGQTNLFGKPEDDEAIDGDSTTTEAGEVKDANGDFEEEADAENETESNGSYSSGQPGDSDSEVIDGEEGGNDNNLSATGASDGVCPGNSGIDETELSEKNRMPMGNDDSQCQPGGDGYSPIGAVRDSVPEELSEEEEELLHREEAPGFDDNDFSSVLNGVRKEREALEEELEEAEAYYSEISDYSKEISDAEGFQGVQSSNIYADKADDAEAEQYDKLVDGLAEYVEPFKDEIDDIFEADRVRKEFAETGKRVNLKRVALHMGARVFERKTLPGDRNDAAFCIAVDNSGSTRGDKNLQEKIACVGIAEALAELNIPLYVFGFNVSCSDNPVQTHFIRWENTRFERERLLSMKASGCNFDSYSIRYATQLLEERTEHNKMLIVISDGCPSAHFSWDEGILQNSLAVNDARNLGIKVLGMSVGTDIEESDFVRMYGRDGYVSVLDPKDLFDNLSERIKTAIEEG